MSAERDALEQAQFEAQEAFERFEQAAAKARALAGDKPREPARPHGPSDYFWWREGLLHGAKTERERCARVAGMYASSPSLKAGEKHMARYLAAVMSDPEQLARLAASTEVPSA